MALAGSGGRWTPVLVVGSPLLAVFMLAEGRSVDARGVGGLLAWVWWLMPFAVYCAVRASRAWGWVVGALYLVASGVLLGVIYASESSTAAIGFLSVPLLLWLGVAVAFIAERLIAGRRRPST